MNRMLVCLDIDGTILSFDGQIPDATHREVDRLRDRGHEVMLATGRSVADTLPIHERLELDSEFVVSANGAMTLAKDPAHPDGYSAKWVETFDPTDVLLRLRQELPDGRYAVESPEGVFRFSGGAFPDEAFEARGQQVEFEELLHAPATRVVVVSPDHSTEEFTQRIERAGLHQVSYSVGWTAWLDIAPAGVNKGFALERVREQLGIPRKNCIAVGDGANDIEMLRWAGEYGESIAMHGAAQDVTDAATRISPRFIDDGLGQVLARIA